MSALFEGIACYLCHLVIETYGKFHVLRTHGRLYIKWILPELPGRAADENYLRIIIKRFNGLEAKILFTLSHRKLLSTHSNERVLPLHECWLSLSTISKARTDQDAAEGSAYKQYKLSGAREGSLRKSPASANAGYSQGTLKAQRLTAQTSSAVIDKQLVQQGNQGGAPGVGPTRLVATSRTWACHKLTDPHHTSRPMPCISISHGIVP